MNLYLYPQRSSLFIEDRCFGGGSTGGGSNAYSRTGTGTHTKEHSVPSYISDLVTSNAANAAPDPSLVSRQKTMYSDIMANANTPLTSYGKFEEILNQPTTGYTGESALGEMAGRNPFSGSYENNTADSFKQRSADAMAQVASGPEAVRGGAARTGIAQGVLASRLGQERGHEIRSAQAQEAPLVLGAVNSANQIERARQGSSLAAGQGLTQAQLAQQRMGLEAAGGIDRWKMNNLQLLQLAAGLQGKTIDTQSDNFSGQGDQSQSMMYGGVDCCFIFLQALNGELPWFIEKARHDYYTPRRRRGYKWMASWLVPRMQRSDWWTRAVNAVIIKPFLKYGEAIYTDPDRTTVGWLFAPYCQAWLRVWGALGLFVKGIYNGR